MIRTQTCRICHDIIFDDSIRDGRSIRTGDRAWIHKHCANDKYIARLRKEWQRLIELAQTDESNYKRLRAMHKGDRLYRILRELGVL
jgi:hypothetical protein